MSLIMKALRSAQATKQDPELGALRDTGNKEEKLRKKGGTKKRGKMQKRLQLLEGMQNFLAAKTGNEKN